MLAHNLARLSQAAIFPSIQRSQALPPASSVHFGNSGIPSNRLRGITGVKIKMGTSIARETPRWSHTAVKPTHRTAGHALFPKQRSGRSLPICRDCVIWQRTRPGARPSTRPQNGGVRRGATRSTSGCGGVRGGFGARRRVPAAFRGFSQVDGRNGVSRDESVEDRQGGVVLGFDHCTSSAYSARSDLGTASASSAMISGQSFEMLEARF